MADIEAKTQQVISVNGVIAKQTDANGNVVIEISGLPANQWVAITFHIGISEVTEEQAKEIQEGV